MDDAVWLDGEAHSAQAPAAGIDLCLHIVRRDHGAQIANRVARRMVVAGHREGGQAQFVEAPIPERIVDDPIGRATQWAFEHLHDPLTVADLARRAHLSVRQFGRRFRAATGTSPGAWLLRQRLQASLPLLEQSDASVEAIGSLVGLPSPAAFRRHFRTVFGVPPSVHRRSFQAIPPDARPLDNVAWLRRGE